MATITRGTKSAGGTAFVDGTDALAAEVNEDFDTIYNDYNGNITEDNFSGSIAIPNSDLVDLEPEKVLDYSADAAEMATAVTPGDSANPSLAADLVDELERLRYRIGKNGHADGAIYLNAADTEATSSWFEATRVGANLVKNPMFEGGSLVSGEVPTNWTLLGTPSATSRAVVAAGREEAGRFTRALSITTDASTEGLAQTISGLKASTKYLVGFEFEVISGGVTFFTTAGLAAGSDYQDPTKTYTTATGDVELHNMIVQTTSAAAAVSIYAIGSSGTDEFRLHRAWFYELSDIHQNLLTETIPTQTASVSAEVTNLPTNFTSGTDWLDEWIDIPTLPLSQYIPGPNYRLTYECTVNWACDPNDTLYHYAFQLEQDDGSVQTIVDGPIVEKFDSDGTAEATASGAVKFTYTLDNPTPGLTYTFSPQVTAAATVGGTVQSKPRLHPLMTVTVGGSADANSSTDLQTISRSSLRTERI